MLPRLDGQTPLRELVDKGAIVPEEGEAFLATLLAAGVVSS